LAGVGAKLQACEIAVALAEAKLHAGPGTCPQAGTCAKRHARPLRLLVWRP